MRPAGSPEHGKGVLLLSYRLPPAAIPSPFARACIRSCRSSERGSVSQTQATNTSLRAAGGTCALLGAPAIGSAGCGLHVATRFVRICAFGAPARGSAGCGLDRGPDPPESLRSRGV